MRNLPGGRDEELVRGLVTETIRKCSRSRDEIAERMSEILGCRVTTRQLNRYTAESREDSRFPVQFMSAFCEATGDWRLLRDVVAVSGFQMIDQREIKLLEIGRTVIERERADKTIAELMASLNGGQR